MDLFKEVTGIEKKFLDLCASVARDIQLELYDIEYFPGSALLRIYIQDPKTQTALIEDCVKMDEAMTPSIEQESWMPEELTLEVSSPGIYRHLRTSAHFQSARGKLVNLVLKKAVAKQKKIQGRLLNVTDTTVTLDIEGHLVDIAFQEIKKASLEAELNVEERSL